MDEEEEEEEEEGEIEEEKEEEKKQIKEKSKVNCFGKKSQKNKGGAKQRNRKRKYGTSKFPDTKYNAIDSHVSVDHQNGLANSNSIDGKNDYENHQKKNSLSQVETIV